MSQQPQLETPENVAESKPIWLTRLALSRPVTICMLFISMLLFGGLASRLLPLEMFPGIDIPEFYVNVPYPNATPAEVERLITFASPNWWVKAIFASTRLCTCANWLEETCL